MPSVHARRKGRRAGAGRPSGASGSAAEGSARECEGHRKDGKCIKQKDRSPVKSEISVTSLNMSLASYLFTIRPLLDQRRR